LSFYLITIKKKDTLEEKSAKMINVAGVISIILFYVLILGVGIWAGRKKEAGNDSEEEVMLAGRSIGLFVGIFTMTGNQSFLEKKIYKA
jgi:hypothetical protein